MRDGIKSRDEAYRETKQREEVYESAPGRSPSTNVLIENDPPPPDPASSDAGTTTARKKARRSEPKNAAPLGIEKVDPAPLAEGIIEIRGREIGNRETAG